MICLQEYDGTPITIEELGQDGSVIKTILKPEEFGRAIESPATDQSSSPIEDSGSDYGGSPMCGVEETTTAKDKIKRGVVNSLEKKGYYWRAIDSIATELGISEDAVKSSLSDLMNTHQIVIAPRRDARGRILYTTRKHYRETRGFFTKLLCALTNQIV